MKQKIKSRKAGDEMNNGYGRSRRLKKGKWTNRMAIMGVTLVVLCLAVAVNAKGAGLRKTDLDYQVKEDNLLAKVEAEKQRAQELQDYKVYVKTKQYAEEVAKEKLGLVKPDEIIIKPSD